MGTKEQVGLKIRTMRKSRGMTQKDLAYAIGQAPSSITMYETGRREPDFETLEALADVFNVPMAALISDGTIDLGSGMTDMAKVPQTIEAKIISDGVDKMPKEKREQAIKVMQLVFAQYAKYFDEKGSDDNNGTEL